ncbi:MAG: hypothetical protein ACRD3M_17820 [Thermoanaerobaculia bacterium]
MSPTLPLALGALLLLLVFLAVLPRRLLSNAQDRLARERLERAGSGFRLLTRAELVTGRYRRLPGILGLTGDRLLFEGLFGESQELATARIRKIETGRRLSTGRVLFRLEVLRITPCAGDPMEFVLTRAAAGAWRSHLGLWAARERQADADRVAPGR